jgi:hypothetical protein
MSRRAGHVCPTRLSPAMVVFDRRRQSAAFYSNKHLIRLVSRVSITPRQNDSEVVSNSRGSLANRQGYEPR